MKNVFQTGAFTLQHVYTDVNRHDCTLALFITLNVYMTSSTSV